MVTNKSVLIILLLATLSACTGKESKRTVHEGPIGTYNENPISAAEATNVVLAASKQRQALSERLSKASTASEALAIALELEPIVLNISVLSNPELAGRPQFNSLLDIFHRSLNLALDKDKQLVVANGILSRYETMALSSCDNDNGGCARLKPYKGDHLASRIVMRIAETLEARIVSHRQKRDSLAAGSSEFLTVQDTYFKLVTRYYRLLQLSYELNNGTVIAELDQKYVQFARDYFEYFRKLPQQDKKHEFHRRHRDTMTLALNSLRNLSRAGRANEQYCRFLIDINPLNPAMFDSMDLDKRSQRSMVSEFIDCVSQKGQLNKIIADTVRDQNDLAIKRYKIDKEDKTSALKVIDEGYAYAKEAVNEAPRLRQGMSVQMLSRSDLAFFILDKVYYRQIDLNLAANYWSRIEKLNDLEFLNFARNYARLQMTYVLKITMENYGRIFKEQFEKKGLGSDFFHEVVKEVNTTSQFDWDELTNRVLFMREFLFKVYDQRLGRTTSQNMSAQERKKFLALQKEYLSLKEELGEISNTIALTVATPMALPLYYYMAKAQGTIKFIIPWYRSADQWFDIQASDALQRFFHPAFTNPEPFFKFGSINIKLDALQKLHVFDFALRIGVFEFIDLKMLPEDKASELPSQVLFFQQAAKDTLKSFERNFRTEIDRLETQSRSRDFNEYLLGACSDPLNTPVTYGLNELVMGTFLHDKAMTAPATAIYSSTNFVFAWRHYRDNMSQVIRIMENHLEQTSAANRDLIVSEAEKELESYQKLERQMIRKVLELDKLLVNKQRDCLKTLSKAEFFRRNQLMLQHIEYFKDVHAAMSILRAVQGTEIASAEQALQVFNASRPAINGDAMNRAGRLLGTISSTGLMPRLNLNDALNEILRVHNVDTAPYDQIGFFVSDVPTFARTDKRIKALNYFTPDRFYQGKWDTLVRTRRMMQTTVVNPQEANAEMGTHYTGPLAVGGNVKIPLGSTWGELELNPHFTNNSDKNIDYKADQRQFLRAAMMQMAGAESQGTQYLSWYSTGGLDIRMVELRLGWLKNLQELGVIETVDTDPHVCPRDEWGEVVPVKDISGRSLVAQKIEGCHSVRVGAQDVMDYFLEVVDLLRVSDLERELLYLMDRPGKMENYITRYFRYNDEPSTAKWTYFDQFYRSNYTSVGRLSFENGYSMDYFEDIRGRSEFAPFKDSYLRFVRDNPALIPLRDLPTKIERNRIRKKIVKHLNSIVEFEESVAYLEDRKVNLGDYLIHRTTSPRSDEPALAFGDWRVMRVEQRQSGARQGTPIYLREDNSAKSWFSGFIETFAIKETDCFVLPVEGDPDFKREQRGTCRASYDQWKMEREQVRSDFRKIIRQTHEE